LGDKQFGAGGARQASGLCLTFDDWFVRGWHGARDLFRQYDAKATFFIAKPDKIRNRGWNRLRALQSDGHEIGCHTMTHARLTKFLTEGTFEDYIAQEILPALDILRGEGLRITSFSYPYFKYRPMLTGLLLQHFRLVREAGVQPNPIHAIYPDRANVTMNIMGVLDRTGQEIPIDYYATRFALLRDHGGFGVFCGHALGPDGPKNTRMTCSYADLEEVLALAQSHGLSMQTMRSIGFSHRHALRDAA